MNPAYQAFHPRNHPATDIDLGLVVELELLFVQRRIQVGHHFDQRPGVRFHFAGVKLEPVAALFLGEILRRGGMLY